MTHEDEDQQEGRKRVPWIAILIGAFIVGLILIIVGFILWQLSHPPKEGEFFPSSSGSQKDFVPRETVSISMRRQSNLN